MLVLDRESRRAAFLGMRLTPGWLEALDPWLQVLRAGFGQGVRGLVRAVVCAGRAGEKWSSAEVALAAARNSVQVAEQAAA